MLSGGSFGAAGTTIVVEEFLDGEEASFIVVTDGDSVLSLATSQDHKARDEGDVGPNTGGMGAYSPAPVVTPDIEQNHAAGHLRNAGRHASRRPPVSRFSLRGTHDHAGTARQRSLSSTAAWATRKQADHDAPAVSLVEICAATLDGSLKEQSADWDSRAALGVVMAAGGYPAAYAKGHAISGLDAADSDEQKVFHAGTRLDGNDAVTSGGRVLCVVGLGESVAAAAHSAYDAVDKIDWRRLLPPRYWPPRHCSRRRLRQSC